MSDDTVTGHFLRLIADRRGGEHHGPGKAPDRVVPCAVRACRSQGVVAVDGVWMLMFGSTPPLVPSVTCPLMVHIARSTSKWDVPVVPWYVAVMSTTPTPTPVTTPAFVRWPQRRWRNATLIGW
jgi:hypothetical protein